MDFTSEKGYQVAMDDIDLLFAKHGNGRQNLPAILKDVCEKLEAYRNDHPARYRDEFDWGYVKQMTWARDWMRKQIAR